MFGLAMTRLERLKQVKDEWRDCNRCELAKTRNKIVWYRGSPSSNLMGVGEGPGSDENEVGKPFIGQAGQTLDSLFEEAGVPVRKVFIINRIGCRPPGNRKPTVNELSACRGRLKLMMRIVKPKVLLLFGATAAELAGIKRAITRHRGSVEDVEILIDGRVRHYPAVITFHPSYLNRKGGGPEIREQMISDIQLAWRLACPEL